jgi:hypothetical protein
MSKKENGEDEKVSIPRSPSSNGKVSLLSAGVTTEDIPVSDFERCQKGFKCGFVRLRPYNQV